MPLAVEYKAIYLYSLETYHKRMFNVNFCVLDYPAIETECQRVGCLQDTEIGSERMDPGVRQTCLDKPWKENRSELATPLVAPSKARGDDETSVGRQRCGCLRTSEKLKQLLCTFPAPPPPTPPAEIENDIQSLWAQCTVKEGTAECISAHCTVPYHPIPVFPSNAKDEPREGVKQPMITVVEWHGNHKEEPSKLLQIVKELVLLVQVTVTATALAMYYLIYCYMQLVYYTLRSALYFHQADGAMKITIGIVAVTSLVITFNLIMRLQKWVGVIH